MKHLKIFSILILILSACITPEVNEGFKINGTIKGHVPEMIFLEYDNTLDSAIVFNNTFRFKGKTSDITEAYLRTPGASAFLNDFIYLENTEIDLELNIVKRQAQEFKVEYNEISIDTIIGTKTAFIKSDFNRFKSQIEDAPNRKQILTAKIKTIINENPANPYSSYLLSWHEDEFDIVELNELLKTLDSNSIPKIRLEGLKRKINPDHNLKVGSQIADFSLTDINGQLITTKELRGKVVLIDFWASWCRPCRAKHPKMKEIFQKFHENDFEILGVSIDTEDESWKKAIKKDELPWLNVIEHEGFKGSIASRYNIMSIPTTYLINRNGEIINIDISLEELETYLTKL